MNAYVEHPFAPVFDSRSRVLILGTMPSPQSRLYGFYYSHPQNRFWPVLAELLGEPTPASAAEKRGLALRRGIALWDVLASCEIKGADDASIRSPVVNDVKSVLDAAPIRAVFTTGAKAGALYKRHCLPLTGVPALTLPSTSPANCRFARSELLEAYRAVIPYCAARRAMI